MLSLSGAPDPWAGRLKLLSRTGAEWVEVVLSDLDAFLVDHALCEKKAASTALALVAQLEGPLVGRWTDPLIALAQEELGHYRDVCQILVARGLAPGENRKDLYVNELFQSLRSGSSERLVDRVLISAVIEARSCERLELISRHLEDPELRQFYERLSRAEARHQFFFVELALDWAQVLGLPPVGSRLEEILRFEEGVVAKLPVVARVH